MTLPVSTATTERSFSAMKIIKSNLRNKMGHGFLADSMAVYIEREISACISSESIIGHSKSVKCIFTYVKINFIYYVLVYFDGGITATPNFLFWLHHC